MARLYRTLKENMNKVISPTGQAIFLITPIDNEQVPSAYVKSVKLSYCLDGVVASNISFLVAASTSSNPQSADDWITVGGDGQGSGTVWLSLKRKVTGESSTTRNDGAVYIHVITQGTNTQADFVCETWGRFLRVDAL